MSFLLLRWVSFVVTDLRLRKHFIAQICHSSGLMDGVLGSWLAVHGFHPWIGAQPFALHVGLYVKAMSRLV